MKQPCFNEKCNKYASAGIDIHYEGTDSNAYCSKECFKKIEFADLILDAIKNNDINSIGLPNNGFIYEPRIFNGRKEFELKLFNKEIADQIHTLIKAYKDLGK